MINFSETMEKFIGTKIVKAAFINLGDYNRLRGWEIPENEDPTKGGYLVGYPGADGEFDGDLHEGCHHISWSPADIFQASYNFMYGMSFGQALEALRLGKKVARKGWNGKGIFIKLQYPEENSKMSSPYIYIDTTGLETTNEDAVTSLVPWLASQTDMLSDDWEIV
jgi:hypothetical protein